MFGLITNMKIIKEMIHITKRSIGDRQKSILCRSTLFQSNQNYIVHATDEFIRFTLATDLYEGKKNLCDKYKRFTISIDIPFGSFEVDEQSTIDCIICWFN